MISFTVFIEVIQYSEFTLGYWIFSCCTALDFPPFSAVTHFFLLDVEGFKLFVWLALSILTILERVLPRISLSTELLC